MYAVCYYIKPASAVATVSVVNDKSRYTSGRIIIHVIIIAIFIWIVNHIDISLRK